MTEAVEKLPISLCITAHNEAENIRRCLDSAASWVNEIIVVINDCTDGTDAIARSYGAKVYEETWHGYRDQKNIALSHATQPWILCLDCDEEVSTELRSSIHTFVNQDDPRFNGAHFSRKVWFLGCWITHGDWYPDLSLRLLRNGKGRFGGSTEHDRIELEGADTRIAGDLHHYSNPTLNHQIEKLPVFGDIFLQRQLERNTRWSACNATFRGMWRFFRSYFLRLGCLDGFPGFYIAWFQAFSTFYRYSRLYEHIHTNDSPNK